MTTQTSAKRASLTDPITVAVWWKNRRKDAIRVRLSEYEGHALIDVRTWFSGSDGKLAPGKGFCAQVKHLPRLVAALTKALIKARELGLVDDEGGNV